VAAKERLAEGRLRVYQRHQKGSPGIQVCHALCDLVDGIVLDLFQAALTDLGAGDLHSGEGSSSLLADKVALVPHGGYGRRDVAPYSDVDLMILYAEEARAEVIPLAERLTRDIFDAGLDLGQSVRSPMEACVLAIGDAATWTSLVESRLLTGSTALYEEFTKLFEQSSRRRVRKLLPEIEKARNTERAQFGETVYLLEPNIKRSPGGLRDLQLLRWIGFARYGTADTDSLQLKGILPAGDTRKTREAYDRLLQIRNEMHFFAGKHADVLDRAEQLRLAEHFGWRGQAGMLPVEEFMRDYFRMTNAVYHIGQRFLASARPTSRWSSILTPLLSHQVERDFHVGPRYISATRRGLEKLKKNPTEVLRLTDLANLYNKAIAPATLETIRHHAPEMSDQVSPETAQRFLSLLSSPARLGQMLRYLHEVGVLEKIIPEFSHARSLLQFNEYHKYTVDEHSFRSVEECIRQAAQPTSIGRAAARIKEKRVLHLALLIHDLGKGYPGDHSDVGREIAARVAERLYLSEHDTEALKFLVHKHLVMSHLAFRRNTSDPQLILKFASEVGSPELLRMLYVLTAADFAAVGPGVWNDWKAEVLSDLYRRVMQHLTGDDSATASEVRVEKRRHDVRLKLGSTSDAAWYDAQLQALPVALLQSTPPERLAEDLHKLHRLTPGEVTAQGRWLPETQTVEFTVGTHEDVAPGIFHRLTGALTSKGLSILSAEIYTLAEGLVLDRFFVQDGDYAGEPPASRLEEVERALVKALRSPSDNLPSFRRVWGAGANAGRVASGLPTRVHTDITTSERYTIVDVFAADCTGLLYTITHGLFQLGLSVCVAKIGTYLDQVVDVFYVTDHAGAKVTDPARLHAIEQELLSAIEANAQRERNGGR
jgi:[protein-PII] uridylyltransferase